MSETDPIAACDRLARFFEWSLALEPRGRLATDDAIHAPVVSFAIAQLRMRIRPALAPEWLATDPVHVVLFGGTNSGKSTVLNAILGREAAGWGVRARLSQHPEAYRPEPLGDAWLDGSASRFAGYRRYRDEHPPRQSDEELSRDGYRASFSVIDPDRLSSTVFSSPATSAVVWDGPDYSTEAAGAYLGAVLDLLALADLVVVTVTDESYADNRGRLLLRMAADSGTAIHVVANKLSDNPALIDDIASTLEAAGKGRAPVHRLPEVPGTSASARLERILDTAEAAALREAIGRETGHGAKLKTQALRGAVDFLERNFDEVVRPLSVEAGIAAGWVRVVERNTRELILEPYRHDYLEGVRYGEFNRTLVHLMDLLQVPGIGPLLDLMRRIVRAPLRLAIVGVRRLIGMSTREPKQPPEEEVLRKAITTWLDALRAVAQALASTGTHANWAAIAGRLDDATFRDSLLDRFDRAYALYREEVEAEVRKKAESLYEKLKEDPRRLNALRGANLFAGAASVALTIKTVGLDWSDTVIGPVVAGLWQNLLEWGLGRYLETLRADLVTSQFQKLRAMVGTSLEGPVRDLFEGAVSSRDLTAAREDFDRVKAEARRIAGGGAA